MDRPAEDLIEAARAPLLASLSEKEARIDYLARERDALRERLIDIGSICSSGSPEHAGHTIEEWAELILKERDDLRARLEAAQKDANAYQTLIGAVASKYPGESRFETVLRYIYKAEESRSGGWAIGDAARAEKS